MRAVILGVLSAFALVATAAADETAPPAPPQETAAPEAPPAPPAPPAPEAPQAAGQGQERLICRRVEATGSRLSSRRQRICGTAADWEDMRSEANRRMRQAGSLQAPGGN